MSTTAIPASLAARIRAQGRVIDPPAIKAMYQGESPQVPADAVDCRSDVPYGSDPRHVLDIYTARADGAGQRPDAAALIYLHGGGFIRGDKTERANAGRYFAAQGIVTVLPNYRLGPTHRWPAGAEDVAAVYAWVQRHARELGIDPQRVFLGGESAGAAHVAAASLLRRFGLHAGQRPAGALLTSGVYNVELEQRSRRQFGIATPDPRNDAYFGTDLGAMAAMSTVRQIDVAAFPLWLSYAELDPVQMQVQAGELFATLVVQHGFAPEIATIAGHNHLSQVYAINTVDDSLAAPMLAFIRQTPRAPSAL